MFISGSSSEVILQGIPHFWTVHSAYLDIFAVDRVSIILSRRLHLSLLARREYLWGNKITMVTIDL